MAAAAPSEQTEGTSGSLRLLPPFDEYLKSFIPPFISQDLGLEGTSLNDILYKNAAFLNLVDPISHELLLSLAREMQCPKKVS